jgi:dTDP-4-amino-4,6-dideoxygalactose transaminase
VCFKYLNYKQGDFPFAEAAALEVVAIPIYPELTTEMMASVVNTIKKYYN